MTFLNIFFTKGNKRGKMIVFKVVFIILFIFYGGFVYGKKNEDNGR